jgi:hypothetical protein
MDIGISISKAIYWFTVITNLNFVRLKIKKVNLIVLKVIWDLYANLVMYLEKFGMKDMEKTDF